MAREVWGAGAREMRLKGDSKRSVASTEGGPWAPVSSRGGSSSCVQETLGKGKVTGMGEGDWVREPPWRR